MPIAVMKSKLSELNPSCSSTKLWYELVTIQDYSSLAINANLLIPNDFNKASENKYIDQP